jgi:hypothetical protein
MQSVLGQTVKPRPSIVGSLVSGRFTGSVLEPYQPEDLLVLRLSIHIGGGIRLKIWFTNLGKDDRSPSSETMELPTKTAAALLVAICLVTPALERLAFSSME